MTITEQMVEALKAADQFITNGIELGFIRMPDASTPDPAHETPNKIRAALAAAAASPKGEGHAGDLCIDCDGSGRYPSGAVCKSCNGTGRVLPGDGIPLPAASFQAGAVGRIREMLKGEPDYKLQRMVQGKEPWRYWSKETIEAALSESSTQATDASFQAGAETSK